MASGWWLARQIAVRSNRRMGQFGAGYEIITAKLPSGAEWSSLRKQFEQEHAEVTEEREICEERYDEAISNTAHDVSRRARDFVADCDSTKRGNREQAGAKVTEETEKRRLKSEL